MQRLFSTLLIALFATAVHEPVAAQAWPSKLITIVVPFPAGGGTDAFARPLFAHMTKQLGQPLIIDNRGGAGGNIGADLPTLYEPAFGDFVARETKRWGEVVKAAGIKLD